MSATGSRADQVVVLSRCLPPPWLVRRPAPLDSSVFLGTPVPWLLTAFASCHLLSFHLIGRQVTTNALQYVLSRPTIEAEESY